MKSGGAPVHPQPLPYLPSLFRHSLTLLLEEVPLNQAKGTGKCWVWGEAPAEVEFGAF